MMEIRIHGRGGQGAVVASKALANAVFKEGKYVQSFPEFGVERRGAPVTAFARIADKGEKRIDLRCKIYEPDHVVILDPTLISAVDITQGLKDNGWIIINTDRAPSDFKFPAKFKVSTIDANTIANKYRLGSKMAPIVNTVILGAFSKITGIVGIDAILEAIKEEVPIKADENVQAAKEAYETAIITF